VKKQFHRIKTQRGGLRTGVVEVVMKNEWPAAHLRHK